MYNRYHIFTSPQTSNISRTLVSNNIVDHSDVVGASPFDAIQTASFIPDLDWVKTTTARRDEKHLRFGIWYGLC